MTSSTVRAIMPFSLANTASVRARVVPLLGPWKKGGGQGEEMRGLLGVGGGNAIESRGVKKNERGGGKHTHGNMGPPGCLTRKLLPLGVWGPNNALSPTRNRTSLGPSFLSTTTSKCSLPSHTTSPNRAAEGEAEKGSVGVLGLGAVTGRDEEPVELAVAGLPSFTPSSLLGRNPWVLSPPDRLAAFATLSAAAASRED